LTEAQDQADGARVEQEGRALEARVRQCARDIREKYVEPPKTTDFAILFLPVEGLFAEVVRRPGLTDALQREQHVVVAGPTTLWALLNSLQMGFRTLAIQKRSSEVWRLLAAVKTEWGKYGEVLEQVHKKLHQASETVDRARVRTRAVGRKLKDVEGLTPGASLEVLSLPPPEEGPEDGEEGPGPGEEPHQVRGLPRRPRGT
jgi:DNA recombination protein RmuC